MTADAVGPGDQTTAATDEFVDADDFCDPCWGGRCGDCRDVALNGEECACQHDEFATVADA